MKLAEGVDVLPLRLAIARQPHLWKEDTYLRHYPQGPFGEVESIMLRFPEKIVFDPADPKAKRKLEAYKRNMLPGVDAHECVDYPPYKLLTDARPLVMQLMTRVAGERLGRVMINKINPGGRIFPHADTPVHAEYWDRFHIVIQSAEGVDFRCGDERVYMAEGECYWFQNLIEHEVVNASDIDRIHMVVDVRLAR